MPLLDLQKNLGLLTGKQDNIKPSAKGMSSSNEVDTFIKPLEKISKEKAKSMKPEEVVEMNGETYSAKGIPAGKEVTVVEDPNTGQQVAGFEYTPSEVVASTGADGNIDYHAKDDQKGFTTTQKVLLIGGGILLLGVLGLVIYKVSKKSK